MSSCLQPEIAETPTDRLLRETATSVALRVIDENYPSNLNPDAKPFHQQRKGPSPLLPTPQRVALQSVQAQNRTYYYIHQY